MKWFERFCARNNKYALKNLMFYIITGNILVYIFSNLFKPDVFNIFQYLSFDFEKIISGEIWRIFSFVFIPYTNSIFFFAIYMYFIYWMGSNLEREWGSLKLNLYYLSGALLSAAVGLIFKNAGANSLYLNMSLFLAFATIFPDVKVLLLFVIPVKVKYLAFADAVFIVYMIFISGYPMLFIPIIALLNYSIYFFPMFGNFYKTQRKVIGRNVKLTNNIVKYRKKPYHNKCVICGKTDSEFPSMDFRYCSKCSGAKCYCSEHLNNHEHE